LHAFLATHANSVIEREVKWCVRRWIAMGAWTSCAGSARSQPSRPRRIHVAYRDAPDSRDKRFIEQIVHYMIERDL
jgi:hypothetical protein